MKRFGALAGLAIGFFFLWLALRKADFAPALAALSRANPGWCLAVFGSSLVFMATKTWRWGWLLRPVGEPSFQAMHRATYIGTAANMVVPHIGEVLRSNLLARASAVPASSALGSVAIERILDMAAVLLIAIPVLMLSSQVPVLMWSAAMMALAFAALGGAAVLDLLSPTGRLRRLGRRLARYLPERFAPGLALQVQRLVEGLATFGNGRRLLGALGLSIAMWACVVFAVWASAQAIGLDGSVATAVAVFVISVVGLTLPSAPATLGTTQLAFVVGFGMSRADPTAALAASFVYTVCFIMLMMAIGGLWWTGNRLSHAVR